jgi:hypothetical protein
MNFDLRVAVGWMFLLIGLLLGFFGFASKDNPALWLHSLGARQAGAEAGRNGTHRACQRKRPARAVKPNRRLAIVIPASR